MSPQTQTLEVVYLPLKPDTDLKTGEAKAIWDSTISTVRSQNGCKALYHGRQIEHPDTVQMIVEWDNISSHQAFMKTPTYPPFLEKISKILGGPPSLFHLDIPASADATDALEAPVTECMSYYFAPDHSNAAFESNWANFIEEANKVENSGVISVTGGWSVEEHKHKNLAEEGQEEGKAKLFGGFIGWPSVEKHMEFRQSEKFGDLVKWIRDGPKGITVWHVAFEKFES